MKKVFLLILTVISSAAVYGQPESYIDFGPKVMVGPNWLSGQTGKLDRYSHDFGSIGYGAGFKFAFDFNESFAIGAEALYMVFEQKYNMQDLNPLDSSQVSYKKSLKFTSIDIPVFARYNLPDMRYVEAGVVFSNMNPVEETIDGPFAAMATNQDPAEYYVGKKTGAMFGFGGYIWGTGNFGISGGLRFRYDFGDLTIDSSDEEFDHPIYALDKGIEHTTNPWSVMFVMEFNYDMQFAIQKSSCSGRRKVIIGNKF